MVRPLLLLPLLFAALQAPAQQRVLQNVQIVDVQRGVLLPGSHDVYTSGGKILKVVHHRSNFDHTGFDPVDGSGQYLIPGLWDMHAHPDDPELWRMQPTASQRDLLLPQFVLNGVTGIRDMGGSMVEVHRWRQLDKEKRLLVPKILACGPLLDGPDPMWDGSVGIDNPSRVTHIVDSLKTAGADFLKVYSLLPRAIYLELAQYAAVVNLPLVGHVPFTVRPSEAAETGMKSQEHLLEILKECSSRSQDFISGNIDYGDLESGLERYIYRQQLLINSFDSLKFKQLLGTFLEYHTWITPTLSMWYKNAWYEQESLADSSNLRYIPAYLRKYWTPEVNDHLKYRDHPAFIETKKELYRMYQFMVKEMAQAGIPLLCGTDMGANPLCFPGTGVHNELRALVAAGLTPAQALKSATWNPAVFLQLEDHYGSVSPGKVADLILLKSNPLQDLQWLTQISIVVQNGIFYHSQEIAAMKEAIILELAP
jgi:hypothetical protein